MVNFTDDEIERDVPLLETVCEAFIAGILRSTHGYFIYTGLSVLNIFFSIFTSLGNTVTIVALQKETTSPHPPTKFLFRSLAVADLCVGFLVQPPFAIAMIAMISENATLCFYMATLTYNSATVLSILSLMTLAFISVDRYLAFTLGLTYRQVVTVKKARWAVFLAWSFIISQSIMTFFLGLSFLYIVVLYVTSLGVCVVVSTFSYTKMFLALSRHQNHVQGLTQSQQQQVNGIPSPNVRQLAKTMSAVLWVLVLMIVLSVPNTISSLFLSNITSTSVIISGFSTTLLLLNSTLNPVVYYWRIRNLREVMKKTIRQGLCLPTESTE